MRRTHLALAIGGLSALLTSAPLQAQNAPRKGDWSIAAQLFNSDLGTVFGLWRMFSDRLNGGMEVEFRRGSSDERLEANVIQNGVANTWMLNIGPSIRYYGMRTGPVSPYVRSKVSVGWSGSDLHINDDLQRDESGFNIQGSLALGAEWYPTRQIAIGAYTGVQYLHTSTDIVDNLAGVKRERSSDTYGTFRSGLELQLFFR